MSAYIQHIDKHGPISSDRKRIYVEETRNELLHATESQLVRAESLLQCNKKRSHEAACFEPETTETRLSGWNNANLSGLDASLQSIGHSLATSSIPTIEQDALSTTAAQLTAPLIHQHDALVSTDSDSVLTEIGYNASINSWLNFPPMDDQGPEYLEYGTSLVDSSYRSVAPQLL